MNIINFNTLNNSDITISGIIGLKQRWKNHFRFNYVNSSRPDNALILILCNQALYTCSDHTEFSAKQNSIVYIPEGSRYSVEFFVNEETTPITTLLINFVITNQDQNRLSLGTRPEILCVDTNSFFQRQFTSIINHCLTNNNLLIKSMLYSLLDQITRKFSVNIELDPIENIMSYIENNIAEIKSIGELSKLFAMSETTLRRKLKEYTKMPPIEYINRLKIEKSKAMLNTTEATMDIICEMLNFYDPSYFNKLFKKFTGITPSQYRKTD